MKRMAIFAALALAACGQPQAAKEEAPAAPAGLFEQYAAKDQVQGSVDASQLVFTNASLDPKCVAVRTVDDKGVVPADAAPDSVYAGFVGARIFGVQCGEQLTTVRAQPRERWLVVLRPGAAEADFVNCADENGRDRCYGEIPRAAAAPAAAEGAADAAKTP